MKEVLKEIKAVIRDTLNYESNTYIQHIPEHNSLPVLRSSHRQTSC